MKCILALSRILSALCAVLVFSALVLAQNRPSDHKTGSVLVFPYYTTNGDGSADTLMSISNHGASSVAVHLYFVEGSSCDQADTTVYLTPNATITLSAFSDSPWETGYLIAVALNQNGCLAANAGLAGSAFLQAPAGFFGSGSGATRGNYGATAFNAYSSVCPAGGELTLNFNGTVLDQMPLGHAIAVQSPNAAPGQTIAIAGMNGNLSFGNVTGGTQIGTGLAFSETEVVRSYSAFILGRCQGIGRINNSTPTISGFGTLRLSGLIPPGSVGTLKFNTGGGVGVLITPSNSSGWSGIRSLTYTRTGNATLIVPVF
jgi:hypothetical protein